MGTVSSRLGKFQAKVRKGHYRNSGLSKTFITRVEAKKWIRDIESKLDRSDFIVKNNATYPTLKGLMNMYLSKVSKQKASYETDVANFKTFSLLFEDLNMPINKLNARMFARFRDKYLEERKASTYQRLMSSIKHMWKIARTEWEYPLENLLEKVRTPKKDNPRDRRLTIEEYKKILYGNHTDYEYRNLILLAVATGLRLGEISGIHREHIDGNTLLIPKRKNGDTNVKVPLSDNAQSVLKNMELPIKLKKRGIQIKWQRLMKKYEIKDLHFHDLRHEAISRYLENGVSIQDVQVLSGHRDIRVLMRVYANLRPREVASKLNY